MSPEEQQKATENINKILFKHAKKFVDNTQIYFADSYFALCLTIGEQEETFVLTPRMVKIVMNNFVSQIALYEKTFGEIQLSRDIPSPIQTTDLKKSDPESSQEENSGKNSFPKPKKK